MPQRYWCKYFDVYLFPWQHTLSLILILTFAVDQTLGSYGDRSYIFQRCKYYCIQNNCSDAEAFRSRQPWYEETLRWSCEDECKYGCMWKTVDAFSKDGMSIPQFHGKWPFTRLFGVQEPASVLFSILNGICHLRIFEYRKLIPSSTPMYRVWTFIAIMMDYFCAFSLVLCNLFALFCRVCGTRDRTKISGMGVALVIFYLQHIYYLAFVKFDYGYNMKVNVACGFLNMIGWLYWCFVNRKIQPYVWKCATVFIGLNVLLSLELGDFPPLFWVLDAHSMWHAGTIPLGYLWYR
ncbi:hypothetical protein FSP39_017130 [Pinctada imbricata]|uniref:Post-GPI attachment to proteins factor 3 n=1 Tax=Pinctada imbricata TaxID=66713 RepID=A0AA88YVI1_PINIB|nr:hypothetical protein FSP39_017130 [Pinctada imbricata]